MDDSRLISAELVRLSRLALAGRAQDIHLFLRRLARRCADSSPELAADLLAVLREAPTASSPTRGVAGDAVPVDADTRIQLLRFDGVPDIDHEPIYPCGVWAALRQLVAEHDRRDDLERAGLVPTRTVLFTGPPGVGKTLAARWLARELGLPLLTLDLAAVMSSYLGRTGTNVRRLLDYAKQVQCVLLLDELDALAKRRDDGGEIGELKRLVTVLLQEFDDWPVGGLLVGATNHSTLLDPAVWRRFEINVDFPMPDEDACREAAARFLGGGGAAGQDWPAVIGRAFVGASFSDIELALMRARRGAALAEDGLSAHLTGVVRERMLHAGRAQRMSVATELTQRGLASQRMASAVTGVSRDAIRSHRADP